MPDAELRVRLQPRARVDDVVGERGDALVVRVTAPPVDGKANVALCRLLADRLGIARGRVELVRGHSARDKVVRVRDMEIEAVRAALGLSP